jgi:dienelactone hydrolase
MANQLLTRETRLSLHVDEVTLEGHLAIPEGSRGLVIFAHGSGSSRHSPRNRSVATRLNEAHLATLLFDLLTEGEQARDQASGELRFDIPFLAQRLSAAVDFVTERPETHNMMLGLFGASTGAAATLMTAARHPSQIAAIVSRGGRPDLAWQSLPQVKAPTLLIVGEMDRAVIELNRRTFAQLQSEKRFEIVSGAGHLFEESGTLDAVADLAAQWFARYLSSNQERLTSVEA